MGWRDLPGWFRLGCWFSGLYFIIVVVGRFLPILSLVSLTLRAPFFILHYFLGVGGIFLSDTIGLFYIPTILGTLFAFLTGAIIGRIFGRVRDRSGVNVPRTVNKA